MQWLFWESSEQRMWSCHAVLQAGAPPPFWKDHPLIQMLKLIDTRLSFDLFVPLS